MPAAHAVHSVEPAKLPAAQVRQVEEPELLVGALPEAHDEQVPPGDGLYVPELQLTQLLLTFSCPGQQFGSLVQAS